MEDRIMLDVRWNKRSWDNEAVDAEEGPRRKDGLQRGFAANNKIYVSSEIKPLALMQQSCYCFGLFENFRYSFMHCFSSEPPPIVIATGIRLRPKFTDGSPPIDEVIQDGWLPLLAKFLLRDDFPELQFEAAWALATVASGTSDHTREVIDQDVVPIFVKLLSSPIDHVREQVCVFLKAVWALGKIAGDSPTFRDIVLSKDALSPLLAQRNEYATVSMLRNVALTLFNFCRGNPHPPFDQLSSSLFIFDDPDVLTCACWALSHLSDDTNKNCIQAVIRTGVCPRLVELLSHSSTSVVIPALRTFMNIARGDDSQRQIIIDRGVLSCLPNLLMHGDNKTIKKVACWTIYNIAAGRKMQNKAVIDAGLIRPLIHLLQTVESDIKQEAAKTVFNLICGGTRHGNNILGLERFIPPLCDLLESDDPIVVMACLKGLEIMYNPADKENYPRGFNFSVKLIDEAEGLDEIDKLRTHDNDEVRSKALEMWEPLYSEATKVWKFFEEMGDLFY
ncbi:OLC1v1002533C1 [Oldenlandia corymbosa var. corymbosa]|uniref:OLC1v1002533C1 n=1 Tax=Oldenlandia corymbosa var. corymbosa TaxID=529605 RepID=A0AAV1DAR9_OLDCO|nr:OLC1v1002533C1 [Oldenlandia corymbosa var. corymbosa]